MSMETALPPNEILAARRQRLSLSVEEVARELNLTVSVIMALESGQYDHLHGDAFILGVLRSYAKLLDLDPEPLVLAYRKTFADSRPVVIQQANDNILHDFNLMHHKYRTAYGVLVVLALLFIISWFAKPSSIKAPISSQRSIAIDTASGTTVIDSMEEVPAMKSGEIGAKALVSSSNEETGAGDQAPEPADRAPEPSEVMIASSLSFSFSADCWVEVRDGDGELIFAAMQQADQKLELSGKPPFEVILGYAPGVDLSYNSEPVHINSGASHVVRLMLGKM